MFKLFFVSGFLLAVASVIVWGTTGDPVKALPLIGLAIFIEVVWAGQALLDAAQQFANRMLR